MYPSFPRQELRDPGLYIRGVELQKGGNRSTKYIHEHPCTGGGEAKAKKVLLPQSPGSCQEHQ